MKLGEITVFFAVRVRKYYPYFSRLHYQYHSTYPGPNWCLLPILLPKFGEHNLSLKRVTAFYPTQKMNFSVKEFFSKCDQIRNSSLFDPIYWRNLNGKLHFLYSTIKATWYYMTSSVSFKLIWFGLDLSVVQIWRPQFLSTWNYSLFSKSRDLTMMPSWVIFKFVYPVLMSLTIPNVRKTLNPV